MLYVEDDKEWRDGLSVFLAGYEDIEWISYAPTADAGTSRLYSYPIHVIVIDTMLNGFDLLEIQAVIGTNALSAEAKIILFTSLDQSNDIFNEAFLHGAYEYVRRSDFEQLPDQIRRAVQCRMYYGEQLMELVHQRKKHLTKDDRRMLKLMLEGKSQQQIARELSLSTAAIVKQMERINNMFNWKGPCQELVDRCVKWGILE